MGQFYDAIPPNIVTWIEEQKMFWVASAPLGGEGHVNVSPKGLQGTFHVESANRVWYEDLTGSGSETMAHLREPGNGRITIMFSAFQGAPRILRLFGRGTVCEFGTPEYEALIPPEKRRPGSRCAVVVDVHKVGTSCGYAVPQYAFVADRNTLLNWCAKLEAADQASAADSALAAPAEKGLKAYWTRQNLQSLDGLPAMRGAHLARVTPVHVRADEAEAKTIEAGGAASVSVPVSAKQPQSSETLRLVGAFSAGLAVAAVYVMVMGIA